MSYTGQKAYFYLIIPECAWHGGAWDQEDGFGGGSHLFSVQKGHPGVMPAGQE